MKCKCDKILTMQNIKKSLSFFILLIVSLLFVSCSAFPAEVKSTPTLGLGSEQGLPKSFILYKDDFSDSASGWKTQKNVQGSYIAYEHQGLRIFVNETQYDFWTTPNSTYSDVRIAVDASKLGGPDDNYYGVICRLGENKNFYAFLISSDGYYGILKVKDGVYNLLSGKTMDYSDQVNRGRGTNRVRGDCVGPALSLYVNGIQLASEMDSDFTSGSMGLIAGSHDVIGVDILFDNFTVYQP